MGSIALVKDFMFQPTPAYKISKAALNMMTVQYAAYLEKAGFIVFSICPGVSVRENELLLRRVQLIKKTLVGSNQDWF